VIFVPQGRRHNPVAQAWQHNLSRTVVVLVIGSAR